MDDLLMCLKRKTEELNSCQAKSTQLNPPIQPTPEVGRIDDVRHPTAEYGFVRSVECHDNDDQCLASSHHQVPRTSDGAAVMNTDETTGSSDDGGVGRTTDEISRTSADGVMTLNTDGTPMTSADGVMTLNTDGTPMTSADGVMMPNTDGTPMTSADGVMTQNTAGTPMTSDGGVMTLSTDGTPMTSADGVITLSTDGTPMTSAGGSVTLNTDDLGSTGTLVESAPAVSMAFDLDARPTLISTVDRPFLEAGNFTKGCKWAPDGTCLLVCSDDAAMRIFNAPGQLCGSDVAADSQLAAVTSVEGELVYDYCWYPRMSSDDPASCCFISSCRDHPIHMYDAFSGGLRCSYRAYDWVDEVAAAYSVSFDAGGERIYAGFDGWLAEFDVSRPGRQTSRRRLKEKGNMNSQGGIVSSFAFPSQNTDVYAVGTYRRSIGLYSGADSGALCILQAQTGGVTHLRFSGDGRRLLSAGRMDPEILCWDMRNLGRILYTIHRPVSTNQRMYFDLSADDSLLFAGDDVGVVRVWQLVGSTPTPVADTLVLRSRLQFPAHHDCCNGISVHPYMPVLATSSGQRHAPDYGSDQDDVEAPAVTVENSVRFWWLGAAC